MKAISTTIVTLIFIITLALFAQDKIIVNTQGETLSDETTEKMQVEVLLAKERSLYRNIYVSEMNGIRCMRFTKYFREGGGGQAQSCVGLENMKRLHFQYNRALMSALFFKPDPKKILIVGLGGGSLSSAISKILPDTQIDVVEIDPAVTRMAEKYFFFKKSDKLHVHEVDGRVFVKRAAQRHEKFDIVILDAFNGEYIPEHMLTVEYLNEVKSVISDGGVMAANTFSNSKLYNSESVTYNKAFGDFINMKFSNRIVLWRNGGLPTVQQLEEVSKSFIEAFKPLGINIPALLEHMHYEKDWDTSASLLSDQYSPSNLLNSL